MIILYHYHNKYMQDGNATFGPICDTYYFETNQLTYLKSFYLVDRINQIIVLAGKILKKNSR